MSFIRGNIIPLNRNLSNKSTEILRTVHIPDAREGQEGNGDISEFDVLWCLSWAALTELLPAGDTAALGMV